MSNCAQVCLETRQTCFVHGYLHRLLFWRCGCHVLEEKAGTPVQQREGQELGLVIVPVALVPMDILQTQEVLPTQQRVPDPKLHQQTAPPISSKPVIELTQPKP